MNTLKAWITKYFGIQVEGRHTILYWIYLLSTNTLILPWFFLEFNGISSYAQLWLLIGFMLTFLFLDGWQLIVASGLTLLTCGASYAAFIGEYGLRTVLVRFCTFVFMGVGIGMVFRHQITNLSRAKKISEEKQKELEAIGESKTNFFANMSHEIRIPITTIVGLNEMTLRETDSDEVYENAVNIQSASKMLLTLIDDIMDLSKIEIGNLELVPVRYEVNAMITDLVNMIWGRGTAKGLDFKIDVAEDMPSVLLGDEVRIRQIVTNLLTNAVKYTEQGTVTLKVCGERISSEHYRMEIYVEDTGIGIKKEDVDKLFSSFQRVNEEKTGAIEGTGLGLSISKQLVELMGGSIAVRSTYQEGSCFRVVLKQGIVDNTPVRMKNFKRGQRLPAAQKYRHRFEAPDARLLVVDDNEMNLLVIKKLLRDTKITIDLATGGRECLEKTLTTNYHLILMDHQMPGLNGEETLKILRDRQDGYCQKTPVVVLTANMLPGTLQAYREKGFDGYLAKPVDSTLLEKKVLDLLPEELIEYADADSEKEWKELYFSAILNKKKKPIGITAVCVCDIPEELIKEYGIGLLHSYVTTENGRFADTNEVTTAGLMEYLEEGRAATSVIASEEEYVEFFKENRKTAEELLFFTLTSRMSPDGYDRAVQAAKRVGNVTVFDSMNLSSGLGLLVLHAARMAAGGAEMKEIVESLEGMRSRVSTAFTVDSVEALYRNRWIGKGVRNFCSLLQVHPVLEVKKGKMGVGGISVGTWEEMVKRHVKKRLKKKRKIDESRLFLDFTGLSARQREFILGEVKKQMEFKEIWCVEATSSISAHCGNGAFALIFVRK